MKKKWSVFFFLTSFYCFCYGQNNLNDLNSKIDSILVKQNVPGCQILVVNSDTILWSKNYGYAKLQTERKVTDKTKFRIASITKTIAAVAAMQLDETKQWSIDDQLKAVLPKAQISNPFAEKIKLIHLLEHTSGLRDISLATLAGSCVNCSFEEAFEKTSQTIKPKWPPGEFMSYSNWGIIFLAEAINQKTGQSYEKYIKQQVFTPLGITNASYFKSHDNDDDFAFGYKGSSQLEKLPYKHMLDLPGSLNISAIELSKFLRMLMNRGTLNGNKILSAESVKSMERTETSLLAKNNIEDAHGKGLFRNRYYGNMWYGHWGDFAGYHSSMYYNRDYDIGYIILINKDEANVYGIEKLIRNHFTQEKEITSDQGINFDQENLGYYNIKTTRFKLAEFRDYLFPFIKISKDGEQIKVKTFAKDEIEMDLISDKIGHYRTQSGYDRFYSFVRHQNQNYLKIGRQNYVQSSFLSAWLRIIIPIFIGFVFLIGFITIPFAYLKTAKENLKNVTGIYASTWLAIVSFLMMMFFLFNPVIQNRVVELLGTKSIWSYGQYLSSILFTVFSLSSILFTFKNGKHLGMKSKFLIKFCLATFLITNVYLILQDMIGHKTWL